MRVRITRSKAEEDNSKINSTEDTLTEEVKEESVCVEKINGVNESNAGVKMVTYASVHKSDSLEEFVKKALSLSWIKSMSETDAQVLVSLGCVVVANLTGKSRVDLWDTLLGSSVINQDRVPGICTDEAAHKIVLSSYYEINPPKKELGGAVAGLYTYWHDNNATKAVINCVNKGFTVDDAYVAASCANGITIDDEGKLIWGHHPFDVEEMYNRFK